MKLLDNLSIWQTIFPDQIAEVKDLSLDKASSGSVTLDEMRTIFRALGQTPTQAELNAIKL
jgi:Ca2+-binding EF-hand superfamily protein